MMDGLITPALIYLSVGGVLWLVLDGLGIIDNTFATRTRDAKSEMVLATMMMIVGWPLFVFNWLKGMWST
jgi:hypothetical protein